jgi:two-component system LytT family response regulator
MIRLRAILVDDERLARQQMSKLLGEQPGIHVVGAAANLEEAVDLLGREAPDVVFLDISLPPASGFDLLPHVTLGTRVVFVTAYFEHAVRAFEARALEYLVKPVHPERLAQAIERVREMILLQRGAVSVKVGERVEMGDRRHWQKIPMHEIAAVVGESNYSRIHTLDGGNFYVRRTMQEWNVRLAAAGFVGLSRSLLVQPAAIRRLEVISRNEALIHLSGMATPIPLGRTAIVRARRHLGE